MKKEEAEGIIKRINNLIEDKKPKIITTKTLRETPYLIENGNGNQMSWDEYLLLSMFIGALIGGTATAFFMVFL